MATMSDVPLDDDKSSQTAATSPATLPVSGAATAPSSPTRVAAPTSSRSDEGTTEVSKTRRVFSGIRNTFQRSVNGIKGAADTITVKSGGISSIPTQYVPKEPEEFRERVTEFAKNKEYYTKFYNIVKKFYQELAAVAETEYELGELLYSSGIHVPKPKGEAFSNFGTVHKESHNIRSATMKHLNQTVFTPLKSYVEIALVDMSSDIKQYEKVRTKAAQANWKLAKAEESEAKKSNSNMGDKIQKLKSEAAAANSEWKDRMEKVGDKLRLYISKSDSDYSTQLVSHMTELSKMHTDLAQAHVGLQPHIATLQSAISEVTLE